MKTVRVQSLREPVRPCVWFTDLDTRCGEESVVAMIGSARTYLCTKHFGYMSADGRKHYKRLP